VIFFKVIPVPAWLVLLWWFALQVLTGLPELMQMNPEISGGVAVWAHVGGFLAGVLLIRVFVDSRMVQAHRALHGSRYGRAGWR
jgi:membrane associated rhomboid family serine protease